LLLVGEYQKNAANFIGILEIAFNLLCFFQRMFQRELDKKFDSLQGEVNTFQMLDPFYKFVLELNKALMTYSDLKLVDKRFLNNRKSLFESS
jgi:hypothetical protein